MKPNYKTNIHSNALRGVANGVSLATDVVRKTMGPKGTNVILEMDEYPYYGTTNDGATIIDKIEFENPLEKIGLLALKEVVSRSNSNSGDGSTTTCVLVDAILQEAIKSGVSGMQLKTELDALLPVIEQKIHDQTRTIGIADVENVATIAGESIEIGKLLAEIYEKIGKDGIITLEGSGTYDTNYSFTEGVRFKDAGFLSPYMVHDEQAKKESRKETKAVYENPTILVTKRKITTLNDINPLLDALAYQGKLDIDDPARVIKSDCNTLVIFTDDMDSNVASILVEAHKSHIMNILIVKAPVIYKGAVFEDFAKCTGATILEDSSGITFKNITEISKIGALGTCGKLTTDKEETILIGIKDISDHVAELKTKDDIESKMRLTWLCQKTVLLKLGSLSEDDLFYKRLKCEDAIYSSRTALNSGIVVGGGTCLLNVSKELVGDSTGIAVLKSALLAPAHQIMVNANRKMDDNWAFMGFDTFPHEVHGYDASTDKIVDMFKEGIVDSAMIVKMAVKNAIGIASTILTGGDMISEPAESPEMIAAKVLSGKGLRM